MACKGKGKMGGKAVAIIIATPKKKQTKKRKGKPSKAPKGKSK